MDISYVLALVELMIYATVVVDVVVRSHGPTRTHLDIGRGDRAPVRVFVCVRAFSILIFPANLQLARFSGGALGV